MAIGTAALIALGDNDPKWEAEYQALGTTADAYDDWHEGRDPAGITTQDPELCGKRFDPVLGGRRLKNYLKVMTLEAQTIARACGKNHLHNLEPEDLCALTIEAAAMAGCADCRNELDSRPHRVLTSKTYKTTGSYKMAKDLAKWAKEKGVKYFMVSYTDLFGGQRAKLVPTQAINDMAVDGAGFAGFATWLDLTPAHPDMMAVPDPGKRHPAAVEERRSPGWRPTA